MSDETKPARARNADYCDAYKALLNNHGYTREQMLIVLKAYERYLEDAENGKKEDVCGLVAEFYDIGSGVFHTPVITIRPVDIVGINPEFWDCVNGKIKLSVEGREFIRSSTGLFESAKNILGGVTQLRRG